MKVSPGPLNGLFSPVLVVKIWGPLVAMRSLTIGGPLNESEGTEDRGKESIGMSLPSI
jgi:hypothetical protein